MKVVTSIDKTIIYTYKKEVNDINSYVKELILILKKRHGISMHGFYQINVFKNSNIGMIVEMIKEDNIDYFDDFIDLKIKVYENCDACFVFNDYFLNEKKDIKKCNNKYYLDIDELSYKDFLLMIEFCDYIYGPELENIKSKIS